jgi:hypothetical protein
MAALHGRECNQSWLFSYHLRSTLEGSDKSSSNSLSNSRYSLQVVRLVWDCLRILWEDHYNFYRRHNALSLRLCHLVHRTVTYVTNNLFRETGAV